MKIERRQICLSLLLACLVVSCEPQKPPGIAFLAWSPDGKHLASIYQRKLFIAEAQERGTVRVFENLEVAEDHLTWSPDSRQIVFTSTAAGSWDLWMLEVETGQKKQLTTHPAKEHLPLWSPSGTGIYFVSWRTGQPDICFFDIQTQKEHPITDDPLEEMALSISKNGERLCYLALDLEERRSLHLLDLPSQRGICLVEPSHHMRESALAPQGTTVAYLDEKGIHVVDVSFPVDKTLALLKRDDRLVVPTPAPKPGQEKPPPTISNIGWSYTGKELLFLESGNIKVRTFGLFGKTGPLTISPGGDMLPVWSPCDHRVAYAAGAEVAHPLVAIVDWQRGKREWLLGDIAGAIAAAKYCLAVHSVDEASRLLERALRESPESGQARFDAIQLLSSIYYKTGRYERLLALHREVTKDHVALGQVHMLCYQDFERARINFEKAKNSQNAAFYLRMLKEFPPKTLRLFCSYELAKRREEYKRAVDYLKRFLQTTRNSPLAESPAFDLGDLYSRHLKEPAKALAAYAAALQAYPKSEHAAAAYQSRGEILWRIYHKAPEAVKELSAAVPLLDPDERVNCLKRIAQIWGESGDLRAAANADWDTIHELICQDLAAQDQTPSQVEFRERKRLDVFLEGLRRTLSAKDVVLASEQLMRLPELKFKSDGVRPIALPSAIALFDEVGFHATANSLLERPALKMQIVLTFEQATPEWLSVLKYAPRDVLVEARLGELPSWIVARLKILMDYLRTKPATPDTAALLGMLGMVVARTPQEVEEVARSLPTPPPPKEEQFNYLALAQVTADYILGNYWQTKQDTAKALDHYEHMVQTLRLEPSLQTYGVATFIFGKCRTLWPKEPAAVKRWLDIERRAAQTIWGVLDLVMEPTDRSTEYAQFLLEFPNTALSDDAYYRLATLGQERFRESYYKKLLSEYPQSPLFHAAFDDLKEFYARRGNVWLAARFAEELEKSPAQARNHAFLELQQGKIYAEALKRPDLGMPHLNLVLTKYPNSDEWAEAKQTVANLAYNAKRWLEALNHLTELIEQRPDFEWVASGDALLKMAECKENLSRWPEAEKDYIQLILGHRDRLEVKTGKLLAEKMAKFSTSAKRELFAAHPEDFVRVLPALKPALQEELYNLFPALKEAFNEKDKKKEARKP